MHVSSALSKSLGLGTSQTATNHRHYINVHGLQPFDKYLEKLLCESAKDETRIFANQMLRRDSISFQLILIYLNVHGDSSIHLEQNISWKFFAGQIFFHPAYHVMVKWGKLWEFT